MKEYVSVLLYLPEYYNPEKGVKTRVKIPEENYLITAEEICHLSGGGIWHENMHGIWWDEDEDSMVYRDELRIFETDMIYNEENRKWIIDYVRGILLKRFKQIAIYIKMVPNVEPLVIRIE